MAALESAESTTAPIATWKPAPGEPLASGELRKVSVPRWNPAPGESTHSEWLVVGPQFPKLEPWGNTECPYPTAPFDAVKEALLHGGQVATFISPERALANLIGAAWRDNMWKSVFVVCDCKRTCRLLINQLRGVLVAMEFATAITRLNDECVELHNGFKLTAMPPDLNLMRGVSYDHLVFLMTEQILHLPQPRGETYAMTMDFGDNYERRQAIRRHGRPWNADLKLTVVDLDGTDIGSEAPSLGLDADDATTT